MPPYACPEKQKVYLITPNCIYYWFLIYSHNHFILNWGKRFFGSSVNFITMIKIFWEYLFCYWSTDFIQSLSHSFIHSFNCLFARSSHLIDLLSVQNFVYRLWHDFHMIDIWASFFIIIIVFDSLLSYLKFGFFSSSNPRRLMMADKATERERERARA